MSDLRRYQVFVSSTYTDLREARQSVTMTLLESEAFPTGMELFPATDDDAWTLIKRVIDESDYYLLIIAGKYGSLDDDTELSYTEMEYDYAVSIMKPVMAFLHGDLSNLPSGQCESTDELRAKLDGFRSKVKKAKHVKFWKTPDELAGQVALTYNKFVRLYPATGWRPADQVTSTESLQELIEARSRIAELEQLLSVARTTAPPGTEDISQGADKLRVPFYGSASFEVFEPYRLTKHAGKWLTGTVTWDQIFGAIAPLMLQEAEQADLRAKIERFLVDEFFEEVADASVKRATDDGYPIEESELFSLKTRIASEVFDTMIVQFIALGLIQRSSQNHGVNDTGIYWSLTPFGETHTVKLRALRNEDVDLTEDGEANDSEQATPKINLSATKKTAAKKTATKRTAAKKTTAKKTTAKKTTYKKPAAPKS